MPSIRRSTSAPATVAAGGMLVVAVLVMDARSYPGAPSGKRDVMPGVRDITGTAFGLATLPLRVTVGAVRTVRELVEQQIGGRDDEARLHEATEPPPAPTAIREPPLPTPEQRAEPRPPADVFREPTPPVQDLVVDEPVSEEPVVVDERADPGAEDGPGPEVHLDPRLKRGENS